MDLTEVKEVERTTNENKVNFLLKEGWTLLSICNNGGQFSYLLVRM